MAVATAPKARKSTKATGPVPMMDKAQVNEARRLIAKSLAASLGTNLRTPDAEAAKLLGAFTLEAYTGGNCVYLTAPSGQQFRIVVKAVKPGEAGEE